MDIGLINFNGLIFCKQGHGNNLSNAQKVLVAGYLL